MKLHVQHRRYRSTVPAFAMVVALGVGITGIGCDGSSDSATESNIAALQACHLLDGTVDPRDKIGACDPGDAKKTTICHIPPGNPANAHTLCVGNPAVPAHLHNHGDYLGQCQQEQPCPPPTSGSTGTGGSGATSGTGGSGDTGSAGAPGAGGSAGAGGMSISIG